MNIVVFDGYLGAGKTLGMSILATYFQMKSDCTLYSNYGLANSIRFNDFEHFIHVADQPSSIICLDEAHTDLDARNFNTNAVKFFTHIIFYLRKLRATIFFATPSIENLDSRVRGICNLYCHVSKNKTHFRYDMYDMQRGVFLRSYKISKDAAYEVGRQVYNTYNIVLPLEYPADRDSFHEFIRRLASTSENYYNASIGHQTPSDRPGALPLQEVVSP